MEVSVGASHAAALSSGGDCFMWGAGSYGRLGFGHLRPIPVPTLLTSGLPKDTTTVRPAYEQHDDGRQAGGGCDVPEVRVCARGWSRSRCRAARATRYW